MLSDSSIETLEKRTVSGLNAPFGARCFLTRRSMVANARIWASLNAPFGARCFLTFSQLIDTTAEALVLMHLLALGAF